MKNTHIIFIIVSTFLTTAMVVAFYNYYFFEPLKSNGELFPERIENFSESDMGKKLEDFETPEIAKIKCFQMESLISLKNLKMTME